MQFCGRVLMFLAAIYPLSEKSALNLSGKVNTNNVTYFESEEVFVANKGVTPSGAEGEEEMEVVVLDSEGSSTEDIAHDMYQAFWNLQVVHLSCFTLYAYVAICPSWYRSIPSLNHCCLS